ncbi:(3R)-hydroxymyristoyl-ACP dehydratase [compost metagenome]
MIETMAQIDGFIFAQPNSQKINDRMVLCGVKNLKIIHPVVPGDTLVVESILVHNIGHLFQIECTGFVNHMKVSTGLISLARLNGDKFKDGSEEESE